MTAPNPEALTTGDVSAIATGEVSAATTSAGGEPGPGPERGPGPGDGRFDELIHPATRLSIVALLASADWVEFAFVRDRLGLSDSALSKQFATLEGAGYVAIERPVSERRRRVRARLTPAGRAAFDGHVAALRAVLASAEPPATRL